MGALEAPQDKHGQEHRTGTSRAEQTTFTFTFSHLADAFIQSDLQLGNTIVYNWGIQLGRSGGPSGQTRTGTQDGDLQSGTDNIYIYI